MLKNNKDVNQKGFTLIEVMVVVADEGIEGINTVTAWCGAQGVHLGYNAIAAEAQGCGLILEALQPCLRTF